MDNENNLTKTQMVLLVLLTSFVVSLTTGIIITILFNQTPPPITNTISKVIKKTISSIERNAATTTLNQKESYIIITQEDLIIKIIERVNPSVVSVVATKDLPVIEQFFVNPFEDDFKGLIPPELLPDVRIPQFRQKGTEKKQISSGSGFLISNDGLIATNRHVVEDTKAEYSVIMNNGKHLPARVLSRDKFQDLAILKIDGGNYPFISLGNSDNIKVGQTAIAIGNALGEFQNTVSAGVISGLKRTITASGAVNGPEKLQALIQTDAAINLGNSGGPLLDLQGRAIGINTAIAAGAENIGFALPINFLKKDLNDIQKFGKIKNPYLGVRYIVINQEIKEKNKFSVNYGALIAGDKGENAAVAPNSPAEQAGIKEKDIILEFDGTKIDSNNGLTDLIRKKTVGDKVNLKILRDEKEINVSVILSEIPENL